MALLLRADASASIGIGHVMRSLALAQAWRHAGEYGRWLNKSDRGFFKRRLLMELIKSSLPHAMIPVLRKLRRTLGPTRELRPWYAEGFRGQAGANGSGPPAIRRFSSAHARQPHSSFPSTPVHS